MAEITFFQILRDVIPPLRADAAALGTLPIDAYRYCEAVREASATGWYCFPPRDIRLKWDGNEVFITDVENEEDAGSEDNWFPLRDGYYYEDAALLGTSPHMRGDLHPMVSNLAVAGFVQIWTGWLVKTAPGHSLLVRPLVNLPNLGGYSCFEGRIRTDEYGPCPLFINIKLTRSPGDIWLPHHKPLFQAQVIRRTNAEEAEFKTVDDMTADDWIGFDQTIRSVAQRESGTYGVDTRRKAR